MLFPNDRSALCLMARNVSPSISHSCARWNLQKYCSSFMGVCRFSRCPEIGYSATTWHVPRKWTNGRALENQNQKWPNIHLNFISCSFVSKILAPTLRALGLGSLPPSPFRGVKGHVGSSSLWHEEPPPFHSSREPTKLRVNLSASGHWNWKLLSSLRYEWDLEIRYHGSCRLNAACRYKILVVITQPFVAVYTKGGTAAGKLRQVLQAKQRWVFQFQSNSHTER